MRLIVLCLLLFSCLNASAETVQLRPHIFTEDELLNTVLQTPHGYLKTSPARLPRRVIVKRTTLSSTAIGHAANLAIDLLLRKK